MQFHPAIFHRSMRKLLRSTMVMAVVPLAFADGSWRDAVGLTRLEALESPALTAPVGASVLQAEAAENNVNYAPDATSTENAGKTFQLLSGASGTSGHATGVASRFYGNTGGALSKAGAIDVYSASSYLGDGFLRGRNTTAGPRVSTHLVQNHSWVSYNTSSFSITDANRRFDYAIDRDGFVAVVGVNNGAGNALPTMLAQAYHAIAVGLTNGDHSAGLTAYDGAGRTKPDIVAPDGATSYATPQVSGVAGLLANQLRAAPWSLTGADLPRVVKALLLAGASKDALPGWSHTAAQPLDARFGAGELNVFHAQAILAAGRVSPDATASVPDRGWAAETLPAATAHTYFFTVPESGADTPFSAVLTWHRVVTPSGSAQLPWNTATSTLANLELRLHSASGFTLGAELDASLSAVDNVEHVYRPALAPGRYALVVAGATATDAARYALAWRTQPVVTIAPTVADVVPAPAPRFVISRTGDTALPLLVALTQGGTAIPGVNFAPLPASVVIPIGASSVEIPVEVLATETAQNGATPTLTLRAASDFSYTTAAAPGALTLAAPTAPAPVIWGQFSAEQLRDPAISAAGADPDHDGRPNLLEFALGSDVFTPDATTREPFLAVADNHLTFTYVRPAGRDTLSYVVEWTADFVTWTNAADAVETVSTETLADGSQRITARAVASTAAHPRQFMRLNVSAP